MNFSEFNLHPDILRGIEAAGYSSCMPVQEQVLEKHFSSQFSGHDLYVQSQTGTGKTAAFLLVIFQRLMTEPLLAGKKALIMAPTRELAVQIEEEARSLGRFLPFKSASFYGGVGYDAQTRALRQGVDIMTGTPGRILDLHAQMRLQDLAFLVLDEADRMFDMGFYPDLRKLITLTPPVDKRQTMLFSATLNNNVKNLAWEYTRTPVEIEIEPERVTVDEIDQTLYHVQASDKLRLLLGLLKKEDPKSAIFFCNTKRYAEILARRLRANGIRCEFIMGDLPQTQRQRIIDSLKAGKINFLVATDVAARGLDVDNLEMVFNYDLPTEAENYVHRIGRTARAGKSGKAISLASEQDVYQLPAIERFTGQKIPTMVAGPDDLAEDKSFSMRHGDSPEPRNTSPHRLKEERKVGASGRRDGPRRRGERTGDRQGRRPNTEPRQANPARPTEPRRKLDTSRLQKMSSDERMAYYKSLYGEKSAAATPSQAPRKAKQQGQSPAKAPAQAGRGGKPSQAKRQNQAPRPAPQPQQAKATPAKPSAGPAAQNKKPGLLSRLKSLFSKKG
jgi:ATP-dependent RNA helicase RhlB